MTTEQPTLENLLSAPRDPEWSSRLAGVPAVLRDELLRRADLARDGSAEEVELAVEVYRAFAATFDPTRENDCERLYWVLGNSRPADRALASAVRRAAVDGRTQQLRFRAGLRLGRLLDYEGDPVGARAQLRAIWETVRGQRTGQEASALFNLGHFEIGKGHYLEGLLHLMRLVGVAEEIGALRNLVMARGALANGLILVGDREGARAQLEYCDDLVPQLDENERGRIGRQIAAVRARLAIHEGRFEDGLRFLGPQQPVGDGRPGQGAWRECARAHALAGLGRHADALLSLDEALRRKDSVRNLLAEVQLAQIRSLAALGRRQEAREIGKRLLRELVDLLASSAASLNVVRFASALAHEFDELEVELSLVRHAEDLAATAAIARLVEIDRLVKELETSGEAFMDGPETFGRVRLGWLTEQHALLDRVAERLEKSAAAHGLEALRPLLDPTITLRVCAWCRCVQTDDDRWLPIAAFLPKRPVGRATHGMCEGCATTVRASFE